MIVLITQSQTLPQSAFPTVEKDLIQQTIAYVNKKLINGRSHPPQVLTSQLVNNFYNGRYRFQRRDWTSEKFVSNRLLHWLSDSVFRQALPSRFRPSPAQYRNFTSIKVDCEKQPTTKFKDSEHKGIAKGENHTTYAG